MRGKRSIFIAITALVPPLVACGASGSNGSSSAGRSHPPRVDPANFVTRVDNPWLPLRPGTTLRYRGVKDGKRAFEVLTVTRRTKRILGVAATVVHDRLYLGGRLEEVTDDWYAQDRRGTVWYFGEATKELDGKGRVRTRAGSFQAGVHGARAGIFMPGKPRVGQSFRQEYYKGQAEDHFRILSLRASVRVPAASSKRAMRTKEWTPLEPGVIDNKYYVRGIGTVRELTVKGGDERLELVSIKRG